MPQESIGAMINRESFEKHQRELMAERKADNDALADMAAAEVLHVLETPIAGQPTITIHNHDNARRLVKAALLAVFEGK